MRIFAAIVLLAVLTPSIHAQCASVNDVVAQLDAARMKQTVDKLVSFGTRHTLSDTTSETRGHRRGATLDLR
jgi:hypothetical protein